MTPIAEIDWHALTEAAYVSIVVGLGVLLVAAFAVISSLRAQEARADGQTGTSTALNAVTAICVIALAAAIVIGIYIMTDK
jgi:heme/copper-type cytochrome/quinol oxidase subunit 2